MPAQARKHRDQAGGNCVAWWDQASYGRRTMVGQRTVSQETRPCPDRDVITMVLVLHIFLNLLFLSLLYNCTLSIFSVFPFCSFTLTM